MTWTEPANPQESPARERNNMLMSTAQVAGMPEGIEQAPVLVGQSSRTRQVLRLVAKLGKCKWPVLLLGETGTGKEVVAHAIHNVDTPDAPFVTIDCSSMVGPLMESELFGHVKRSFTGAVSTKIGLIEAANGGTAFFDEIGELPLDLQAKLLRVLQQKEFRPVGALTTRKSDFRIIAATNRDLAQEVERGTFRRDLYYRLNVVNVRLAPLRERKEDIPLLIAHFMKRYGHNHTLTQESLQAMLDYEWPGNVRELENCIQHMVALNSGPLIQTGGLPSTIQNPHRSHALNVFLDGRGCAGLRYATTCKLAGYGTSRRLANAPSRRAAGRSGEACDFERHGIHQGRPCDVIASARHRAHDALPQAQRVRTRLRAFLRERH